MHVTSRYVGKTFALLLSATVLTSPAFAVDDPPKPGAAPATTGQIAAPSGNNEVTADRLLNADKEPQNWLMVHKEYNSNRYSALDQINRDTVKNLRVAFTTAIGGLPGGGNNPTGGLQGTPLVNNGFMYVVDAWGSVYKIDVRDGKRGRIMWVMDPGVNKADVWIASNRGVALYKNMVISVTGPGKVIWTDAETGEQIRSVQVDDPKNGYALTAPPLVIGNKLIVGGSGGDQGARDHVTALDADTGKQLWRTYSVPAAGEPGSETWGGDNAWMHGGGAFWVTGSYDPDTKLTLWGSGQPVPMFDPEYRPGDNLFTNSTIAFDVETGKMKWYFQYTPGDFLDYDEVGSKLLVNKKVDGEDRKLLAYFGRNGFYYVQDRTNGQFLKASQYVKNLNWTDGIDPKTGKPIEYDPNKKLQTYKIGAPSRRAQGAMNACPHIQGGVNMFPTSYSQRTGMSYGAGIEGCSKVTADPERSGGKVAWNGGRALLEAKLGGSITAVDPSAPEKKSQHLFDYPIYSGVVSTGGGLVFTASVDGTVYALNDQTLEEMWSFNVGAGISAPPMTYAVNGKQYVAIMVGHNRIPKGLLTTRPEMADLQTTSMIYVFGL